MPNLAFLPIAAYMLIGLGRAFSVAHDVFQQLAVDRNAEWLELRRFGGRHATTEYCRVQLASLGVYAASILLVTLLWPALAVSRVAAGLSRSTSRSSG